MHSKHKGTLAEAKVIADLYQKGYSVAIPLDDLTPFDLICTDGDYNTYKVQVKYCKVTRSNAIEIELRNSMSNKTLKYTKRYSPNEVDVFAVYIPDIDECLYIKSSDIFNTVKSRFTIRLLHAANNQVKRTHMKDKYTKFPY